MSDEPWATSHPPSTHLHPRPRCARVSQEPVPPTTPQSNNQEFADLDRERLTVTPVMKAKARLYDVVQITTRRRVEMNTVRHRTARYARATWGNPSSSSGSGSTLFSDHVRIQYTARLSRCDCLYHTSNTALTGPRVSPQPLRFPLPPFPLFPFATQSPHPAKLARS